MNRVHNFCAGPCVLPDEVIASLAAELPEHGQSGMSIIEQSHRGSDYGSIHEATVELVRRLAAVPDSHEVLLVQGGATLQFAMSALNLDVANNTGAYVVAGTWGAKALADAQILGEAYACWDGSDEDYVTVPSGDSLGVKPDTKFLHYTSNETIHGLKMGPYGGLDIPVVADMSSDFLTRPIDWDTHDVVYAGAQKSLGPAGLTVVIVSSRIADAAPKLPAYLSYRNHIKGNSLSNTPPVFSIWGANKMLSWIESQGGVSAMSEQNTKKASLLYEAIDASDGYYSGRAALDARSMTNVVFNLETEDLESKFLSEANVANLVNLKGHRSIGGVRASLYNGLHISSVEALIEFMKQFQKENS